MNLNGLYEKFEKFCASLETDDLYLLRGLIIEEFGAAQMVEKIDKLIVYRENRKHATHDEFLRIMNGAWGV